MSLLDFLISPAHAQAGTPGQSPFYLPIMFGVMAVVFYFMLIRPQMRRNKEQRQMLGGLAKGDEVVTGGGIAGRIANIGENYVSLEVADGVVVKIQKAAVTSVLPKGTLKGL